jgi:ribonuclease T1
VLLIGALACSVVGWSPGVGARPSLDASSTVGVVRVAELPAEGRRVLSAIHAGGPFVSPRDGMTFGNREGILPRRMRGYYAEYTVPTPGARNRGARRIIAGRGDTGDFRTSNEYYYTADHYQSFRRIVQ